MIAHSAQGRDGDIGREHQRAARGAGSDGSIHGFKLFDFAVDFVALGAIGSGDAPDIGTEAERKEFGEIETVEIVGARRIHGVLKEIDEATVAAIPKIHPSLRVLMREQRAAANEMIRPVGIDRALPGVPGFGRNGVR